MKTLYIKSCHTHQFPGLHKYSIELEKYNCLIAQVIGVELLGSLLYSAAVP